MMHIPQVEKKGGMAGANGRGRRGEVFTIHAHRLKQRALTALTAPLL